MTFGFIMAALFVVVTGTYTAIRCGIASAKERKWRDEAAPVPVIIDEFRSPYL